jgi:hypothetical protein
MFSWTVVFVDAYNQELPDEAYDVEVEISRITEGV